MGAIEYTWIKLIRLNSDGSIKFIHDKLGFLDFSLRHLVQFLPHPFQLLLQLLILLLSVELTMQLL